MRKQITLRLPKEAYEALKKQGVDLQKYESPFAGVLREKNISISALSRETGISRPTLTLLRDGATKGIQFDTLERLCAFFEMDAGEMMQVIIKSRNQCRQ